MCGDKFIISGVEMPVGIIGYGNVGKATHNMLRTPSSIAIYDPPMGRKDNLTECQVAFVCLPTPSGVDGHDLAAFDRLPPLRSGCICCVRSTVSPGQIAVLAEKYPGQVWCYLPEFRTEEKMREGIESQLPNFVGVTADTDLEPLRKVIRGEVIPVPPGVVEIAKLSVNAILAMHVAFANEVFELARGFGVDWEQVREVVEMDQRVGSHFRVTDERGYGGPCLPKDIVSFLNVARVNDTRLQILESVNESNDRVRSLKDPQI